MSKIFLIPLLFSMICILNCTGCAETQLYTYHSVDAPSHIVHPTIIPIWIDSGFSKDQAESIKDAIGELNKVLNGQMVLKLESHIGIGTDKKSYIYPTTFASYEDGQALVDKATTSDSGWVIFAINSDNKILENTPPGTVGFVKGIDEHFIMIVVDRIGTRSLKDIVMHEMGHLLGALHVNAPSLEYPAYGPQAMDCIDKITAAQISVVRRLDFNKMTYCSTPMFL